MKYIWMMALCASLILVGCGPEKEEATQSQLKASISKDSELGATKAAEAAKVLVAEEATKAEETAKAEEGAKAAEVAKATEAVKAAGATAAAKVAEQAKTAAAKATTAVGVGGAAIGTAAVATPVADAGDAINGKNLAKRCKGCHSFKPDRKQMTGPNLFGVFGKTAGKNVDFGKYSDDLKNASFVWDEASLAAWVCSSKEAIKTLTGNPAAKTRMGAQKKCGPKGQDIAAYLKNLK
jgi:cytochrome c2